MIGLMNGSSTDTTCLRPESMSQPEDTDNPRDAVDKDVLLTFEEQISHLDAGYRNSQSVVRFLDTKAAATIGAVPVLLGMLSAVFAWLHDEDHWGALLDEIGVCVPLMLGVAIVSVLIVFAFMTVRAAFDVIAPRDAGNGTASVLFPQKSPEFESRLASLADLPSQRDVIEDYRRQITRMSGIVSTKMKYARQSMCYLKGLFGALVVAFVYMLLTSGLGYLLST